MNTRYFAQDSASARKVLPPKSLMKVSKACIATCIVGGAAMATVSFGAIFGVPPEGAAVIVLGIVSLLVGLFAGIWLYMRAL